MNTHSSHDDQQANPVHAGFWLRLGAYLLDLVIIILVSVPIFFLLREDGYEIVVGIWATFYYVLFECSPLQATPAKLLLGLKVTDWQGQKINFARSFARNAAMTLCNASLGIGYLMVGFTQKKQGLHDIIANCLVVKSDKRTVPAHDR